MNAALEHQDRIFSDLDADVREKLLAGQYDDDDIKYLTMAKTSKYLKLCPLAYRAGQFGRPNELFKRVAATNVSPFSYLFCSTNAVCYLVCSSDSIRSPGLGDSSASGSP